jgi:threonine aldolase
VARVAELLGKEAALWFPGGTMCNFVAINASQLHEAVGRLKTAPAPYGPPVRRVCVEQTHNFGGGSVWSGEELRAVADASHDLGLAVHMDGARLLNACAATGVGASAFATMADSVWIVTPMISAPSCSSSTASFDHFEAPVERVHLARSSSVGRSIPTMSMAPLRSRRVTRIGVAQFG